MPGVARDSDACGGSIIGSGYTVFVNGKPAALVGDRITGHGDSPTLRSTIGQWVWFCFFSGKARRKNW